MKRFLWLSFFLLCSGRLALGQGGAKVGWPKAHRPSSTSGDVVEAGPTGCLVEKDGTFLLRGDDFRYYLKGHQGELAGHDGDEVRVTGTVALPQRLPPSGSYPVPTIQVKTVQILHDNNPAGRTPVLGSEAGWKTIISPLYGLRLRIPKAFTDSKPALFASTANFVATESSVKLGSFSIPAAVYPNTNFGGGSFAIFVNPDIQSEGACGAFADFEPKFTSLATIYGIVFGHTVLHSASMGSGSTYHNFHTYRNGLCYEFDFDFDTAYRFQDDAPFCSVQWIYTQNERQLIDAVLSTVRFVKPQFQRAEPAKPRLAGPPVVTSFTQSPVPNKNVQIVRLTWSTQGTDYVRIHIAAIKDISVGGEGFYFYNQNNHNFSANGHANFLLANYSKALVTVPFTIVPFRAGVAYPKQSRTLTLDVKPGR